MGKKIPSRKRGRPKTTDELEGLLDPKSSAYQAGLALEIVKYLRDCPPRIYTGKPRGRPRKKP